MKKEPKKKFTHSLFLFLFALCAFLPFFLFGCATKRAFSTSRMGLLDHFRDLQEAASQPQGEPKASARVRELASTWRWPLKQVQVTSPFGKRGEEFHEGVDLRAPKGTPVYAADAGTVLYAGNKIVGYGKMIVLTHAGEVATVYGHNSKLNVKTGEKVIRGQKIASSGYTGRATGAHLHFEVREGSVALNPLSIMPPPLINLMSRGQ